MSYASVGQVNFNLKVDSPLFSGGTPDGSGATRDFCPPPRNSASGNGPPAKCNGGIHATNCKEVCCKLESWTNNTYKDIKGQISLQKLNEDRIMHLFAIFSAQNNLATMAYDLGVQAPSAVEMASYIQAFQTYFQIFQPDRWIAVAGPRKGCDGGGRYDVWATPPGKSTWTTLRVTTLEKLAGPLSTQARARAIGKVGVPYNQFLPAAHTQRMDQLVNLTMTVPTSALGDRVGMRPTLASVMRPVGGKLQPYGWFANFLAATRKRSIFEAQISSSIRRMAAPSQFLADRLKQEQPPPRQYQSSTTAPQQPLPTSDEDSGIPTMALVAGGVIVAGGVAYFAMRK